MIFDPFGDFESRGYLRNVAAEKDHDRIKRLEHRAFLAQLNPALQHLARIDRLAYRDVLDTHKTLFGAVYPWAGKDRAQTAPDIAVSKGSVLFAHPKDARAAVEYGLRKGQDKKMMAEKPGEIMGYLAYGHPFLDGNGRTIMVVHTDLAHRAGISIDWPATNKRDYLTELTRELNDPGKGHLDNYLKPFVRPDIGREQLAGHIKGTPGLEGKSEDHSADTEMLGRFSDPALQERYRHQVEQRERQLGIPHREPPRDKPKGRGGR